MKGSFKIFLPKGELVGHNRHQSHEIMTHTCSFTALPQNHLPNCPHPSTRPHDREVHAMQAATVPSGFIHASLTLGIQGINDSTSPRFPLPPPLCCSTPRRRRLPWAWNSTRGIHTRRRDARGWRGGHYPGRFASRWRWRRRRGPPRGRGRRIVHPRHPRHGCPGNSIDRSRACRMGTHRGGGGS